MKTTLVRLGVSVALGLISATVLLATVLHAQDTSTGDDAQTDLLPAAPAGLGGAVAAPAPAYVPLTLGQKYKYALSEIFGPDRLVAMAGYAVLDQMGVRPAQWGKRPSSLAIRFASHFGASFLNHNIAFGVGALDHEDPRYFRSGHGHAWNRAGNAVVHTFVVRSDRGGWMPAYSIVAADLGTPYLVRRWEPQQFQTATALQAGAVNIGIDIGANVLKEFWPDMRKALPNWFTRNNPLLPPADVD